MSGTDGWPTKPPDWLGDVAAGVDAWTQRATEASAEPASGGPRPRRSAGGRGFRKPAGTRRTRRAAPPPEDGAAQVPEADPESVARKILLDQLTGAARSRGELRKKLDAKDVPEEIAERLLDRFTEVGLIDDRAFAENWVQGRHQARGLAPRALAQELRRKGIDDQVAREALELIDEDSQREAAQHLVRKKIRNVQRVDRATATRRLVAMLARKGYGGPLAWSVVNEELAAVGFGDEGDSQPDW